MTSLDWRAVRAGGSVALVFAVPLQLVAAWLADREERHAALPLLVLGAFGGFVLGAGVAAWTQNKRLPLLHGIVCGTLSFAIGQALFLVVKLLRGGDVNWFNVVFNLTMSSVAGLIGGGVGAFLLKRGLRPSSRTGFGQ
jgi:hypothetical protein